MKSKKLSEVIIKTFKSNGFVLSEPDVLLDSDYIIERSGEKFRSSMLTFDREDGKTMCLRPDLTVASCISFLQNRSSSKIYYSGQAYRRSGGKGANFINDQLGIEILGSKNLIKDDFKVISTILNSAKKIKMKKIKIKVSDISLFKSLINALEMPQRWKLRLIRHFWRPGYFEELLKRLEKNTDIDAVTFDADKKRFYETPDGNLYPSITTVLNVRKREGLAEWRKRVGEEEANRISTKASKRGTKVHGLIEKFIANEEWNVDVNLLDLQVMKDVTPAIETSLSEVFAIESCK